MIANQEILLYNTSMGNHRAKAAYPPLTERLTLRTRERRAMLMYVTYSDLIPIGILLVTFADLFYEIYRDKK